MVRSEGQMVKGQRQRAVASGSRWLGRADWMEAGQQLLMSEGIAGMRLTKLTKRLKVSTGSFYHHFSDMDDYLGALADYFNVAQVQGLVAELAAESPDPMVRIRHLASRSLKSSLFALDRAMRVWAASDPRAAASVKQAEKIVLDFIADAFEHIGFGRKEARTRARILLTAAITPLLSSTKEEEKLFREEVLAVLLESEPGGSRQAAPKSGSPPRQGARGGKRSTAKNSAAAA
ncbi:TetR/AcrR family transcriptional regulator [Sphingobium indicum]|uniref:TetR/AcrR family transcriptional regulator n=1 Tax=Sphingobium indicum TaxID=332055 RepID=UPI0035E9321F